MSGLTFDQVSVQKAGGYNLLSANEFLAMPLMERVQLLGAGKCQFYLGGEQVSTVEAIRSLRAA